MVDRGVSLHAAEVWFQEHFPLAPAHDWWDAASRVCDTPSVTDPMVWANRFTNGPVYQMIRAWCAAHDVP